MNRLQTIADIRESSPDDDGHRIVEIRTSHLVFDVDGNQVLGVVAQRQLLFGFLVCQTIILPLFAAFLEYFTGKPGSHVKSMQKQHWMQETSLPIVHNGR